MRKLLLFPLLLLLFAAPSFALFHIGVSGGYSYSSLDNINTYWEKIKADAESNTLLAGTPNWTGYGSGLFANVDLNFNIDKNILVGVRSGLQYIFPSTYSGFRQITFDVPPPTLMWVSTETSTDDFLIPLMAGLNYYTQIGDTVVAVRLEAYGGYGLAYSAQRTTYAGSYGPFLSLYGSGGFMADVSGAIEFNIFPGFALSLNGGYRWAKMSDFKSIQKVSAYVPGYGLYTIPTNDPFNDGSGKPIAVDFTGINIGIGVNIRI